MYTIIIALKTKQSMLLIATEDVKYDSIGTFA